MKILHFIIGKANPNRANGVNHVINGLCKFSTLAGHDVRVVGVSKNMVQAYELVQRDQFEVLVYNKFFGKCFEELKRQAKEVDIVHLHSVWQHYNIFFARYLKSINKPYIVTVHSGLTEDRIKQSNYWIKLIYHKFFQKNIFDSAAGIHAITREEMTDIFRYTSNKNIFFVQNGIDLKNFSLKNKEFSVDKEKIEFGYLGRFGLEKNVSSLIKAIALMSNENRKKLKCFLIGPIGEEGKILKKLVEKLDLLDTIQFTGPLYGADKYEKLNNLDFYVHPAFSDVVSIAVMEAMASGLPSIITRTSQVSYFYNSNAFVMTEPLIGDIKRGLERMIDRRDEWTSMSKNSIKLVKDVFNWESAVTLLLDEYKNIINKKNNIL